MESQGLEFVNPGLDALAFDVATLTVYSVTKGRKCALREHRL